MKLLRQENAELRWQGSAFNLIGVDYQRQRDAEGNRAPMLAGVQPLVRRDVPNILLSHNPNSFPRAAELGIELSLAGHTHGGQVRVEILDHRWSPAEFLTPYVAGLYQRPLFAPSDLDDNEIPGLRPDLQPPISNLQHLRQSRTRHDRRARPPGRPSGNHAHHFASRGLSSTDFSLWISADLVLASMLTRFARSWLRGGPGIRRTPTD